MNVACLWTGAVTDDTYFHINADDARAYERMLELCQHSIRRYMTGLDLTVTSQHIAKSWPAAHMASFNILRALNEEGHSVLRLDADMVLTRPFVYPTHDHMVIYGLAGCESQRIEGMPHFDAST